MKSNSKHVNGEKTEVKHFLLVYRYLQTLNGDRISLTKLASILEIIIFVMT